MKTKLITVIASVVALGLGSSPAWAGNGQFQAVGQKAITGQNANANANAGQNAVNANVPVTIAGGNVTGGTSSANQTAKNAGVAAAVNAANTSQQANATQIGGRQLVPRRLRRLRPVPGGRAGRCHAPEREVRREGEPERRQRQRARDHRGRQRDRRLELGEPDGGQRSRCGRRQPGQHAADRRPPPRSGGASSCLAGCGGSGQFQAIGQGAATLQNANANANANQNAVNANTPVTIAGGNVTGGPSSANQTALNGAGSLAANGSNTHAAGHGHADRRLAARASSAAVGPGQFQAVGQHAATLQNAYSNANANQNAINGNAPVTIAGGNVTGGPSSANQTAGNLALGAAVNGASTGQQATATQIGGRQLVPRRLRRLGPVPGRRPGGADLAERQRERQRHPERGQRQRARDDRGWERDRRLELGESDRREHRRGALAEPGQDLAAGRGHADRVAMSPAAEDRPRPNRG